MLIVGAPNSGAKSPTNSPQRTPWNYRPARGSPTIPQRPVGRDVWWWPSELRLDRVSIDTRLGKRLAGRDQLIGVGPRHLARHHNVAIKPRATSAAGRTVSFTDGSSAQFDAVVWATGYTTNQSWIDVPEATNQHGHLTRNRGVTPSPGLYTLGMAWQHTRGSAPLGWVGADAAYLAEQISAAFRAEQHTEREIRHHATHTVGMPPQLVEKPIPRAGERGLGTFLPRSPWG